jgi:hypothetical protein
MRKLSRTQLRGWTISHLTAIQGGLCPLCNKKIDYSIPREAVVDHNHDTGEIRGVLHRSCNAAEGKVSNAAGRWGAKSSDYVDIIAFLKNLVTYLENAHTGLIYPDHKTPEQKAEARRVKRNTQAATRRATAKVRVMLPKATGG